MIICLCHGVSDRVVRLAVLNGADSVDAVGDRCGAGTDCGSCRHAIGDLVDEVRLETGAAGHDQHGERPYADAPVHQRCGRSDSGATAGGESVAAGA